MIIVAVLLLTFLISVMSVNITQDTGQFHEITKKNGVVAGLGVVLTNDTEHESQLSRLRRSVIAEEEKEECYKQFFIGRLPPTGFHGSNPRYICQEYDTFRCFSTMFDLDYGIPIYAGYRLQADQVSKLGTASRSGLNFRREKGIPQNHQGSAKMYSNAGALPCIHKGHLVPAQTYSFSDAHIRSTFTYTNAVPQYAAFNSGQWSEHERMIRNYAEDTCSKLGADLYLLTGISERRITLHGDSITAKVKPLVRMPELPPNIVIPNSMWTAGCCVSTTILGQVVRGSFAVIGNNVPNTEEIYMNQVTVKDLTTLLKVTDLFPGKPDCSDNKNDVTI